MNLTGKTAVISGGTHGMGLAAARLLIDRGAKVIAIGRNQDNVRSAQSTLGSNARVLQCDTTSLAAIDRLAATVRESFGGIDLAFINAGVSELGPFEAVTEDAFDRMFAVNTKGAFFMAQRLSSLIRPNGAIVFTTVAEGPASANLSVYAGTKAAVRAFAQVMAAELVTRNIRVNAVGPGFIDTPTLGVADLTPEQRSEMHELGDRVTPMRRHGTPEEVARAVLFLAFEATFTTGIELAVDGGLQQIGVAL
jgi:hypothetical protein